MAQGRVAGRVARSGGVGGVAQGRVAGRVAPIGVVGGVARGLVANRGARRGGNSGRGGVEHIVASSSDVIRRLLTDWSELDTFSDFYVPFLRSVFEAPNDLSDRILLSQLLRHYWPEGQDSFDDSIIIFRTAYSVLPMYGEILISIHQSNYYIQGIIQEYLLLDFQGVDHRHELTELHLNLRIYIETHANDEYVTQMNTVTWNFNLAIQRFRIDFSLDPEPIIMMLDN